MRYSVRWTTLALAALCVLLGGLLPAQAQTISIDGVFFDWDPAFQIDLGEYEELTYEEGDPNTPDPANTSYWVDLDIKDLYALVEDDHLYLRVSLNDAANIFNTASDTAYHGGGQLVAYFDVDNDSATGLTWDWWGSGYDVYVQVYPASEGGRYAIYEHTQEGHGWSWIAHEDTTAAHAVWNASGNDVEIAIPLSYLRNPLFIDGSALGDTLALAVMGSEPEGPWRADVAPNLEASAGLPLRIGDTGTAVEEGPATEMPTGFELLGNYPNPFNPATTIRFALGEPSRVQVRVFDLLGRQVAMLVDGQVLGAGVHDVRFEAADRSSGLYLYRVETTYGVRTGTMMLLK